MRLIDVDAATFPTPHRKEANDYMRGWNLCLRSVLQQPAVDAMPVVHGYWITCIRHEHYPSGKEYEEDYCSVCSKRGSREDDYCPHCGAKMDGGDQTCG